MKKNQYKKMMTLGGEETDMINGVLLPLKENEEDTDLDFHGNPKKLIFGR